MSISGVSSSSMSGMSQELQKLMQQARSGQLDSDEFASSIISNDDADGDGLLSLDETPLDEERFNAIDADGDGYISAEELSASAEENMSDAMNGAVSNSSAGAAASGSSGGDSEEEYDEYDYNQDGEVTYDELLRAFQQGDMSLSDIIGDSSISALTQRLAMQAYGAQSEL